MTLPSLDELKAEFERQNHALAELATAMAGASSVEVPPGFFTELDEACEVRSAMLAVPVELQFAMRA